MFRESEEKKLADMDRLEDNPINTDEVKMDVQKFWYQGYFCDFPVLTLPFQ